MYQKGLISVIISSYNHGQWVGKAIESVISQTYKNIELIIIDDCSTDNSPHVIEEYAKKYDCIKFFQNEQNEGVGYTQARSIKKAKGEFVSWLGSDDIWYQNKLETQINFLNNNLDISAVFSLMDFIDNNGEHLDRPDLDKRFNTENRDHLQWLRFFIKYSTNLLGDPSVLLRRSALDELGDYTLPHLRQTPDFDLWTRLCIDHDIHILKEKLLAYRLHSYNTSVNVGVEKEIIIHTEFAHILDNFKKIKSVSNLIEMFPEHKDLMRVDNPLLIPFYLAKIISFDNIQYKNIWSILELYKCFGDPKVYKLIRENNLMTVKELQNLALKKNICQISK